MRPSITRLVATCLDGERLCVEEAAEARAAGDVRSAAWWDGRAADWRRYLHELRAELASVAIARAR